VKRSYLPFIALGVALIVVALGAMVYLLVAGPDGGVREVPTELQVLGSSTTTTTTAGKSAPAGPATTLGLRASTTTVSGASATTTKAAPSTTQRPAKDANGLTIVRAAQLPKEAQQTLALIAKGGPYPYDRDGVVFENREGVLAKRSSGYYHEYTVVTPGGNDRGARRIIAGNGNERYYTADHYETFVRVEEG
jgi:ribonuclease T1